MLKKTQKEGTLRKSEENGRSIHLSTIVNEHCENVDLLSISTNVKVSYLGTLLNNDTHWSKYCLITPFNLTHFL